MKKLFVTLLLTLSVNWGSVRAADVSEEYENAATTTFQLPSSNHYKAPQEDIVELTKETLPNRWDKTKGNLYTTKYLPEVLQVIEHQTQNPSLTTIPYDFVMTQLERARKVIGQEKGRLFNNIVNNLLKWSKEPVDLESYNYTCLRLMALANLDNKLINTSASFKKEILQAFEKIQSTATSSLGASKAFMRNLDTDLSWRLSKLNLPTQDNFTFLSYLLVHLDIEGMKKTKTSEINFVTGFLLNNTLRILDKLPFMGTQTIVLSMLNELDLVAAPLTNTISAHGYKEYEGIFGIMAHDLDHAFIWKGNVLSPLKELGLTETYMNYFMDIYKAALKNSSKTTRKAILDFLFIMMHEDANIGEVVKAWDWNETNYPPSLFLMLVQLYKCDLPTKFGSRTFQDLGRIVATNKGYEEASTDLSQTVERFRNETLALIVQELEVEIESYNS